MLTSIIEDQRSWLNLELCIDTTSTVNHIQSEIVTCIDLVDLPTMENRVDPSIEVLVYYED